MELEQIAPFGRYIRNLKFTQSTVLGKAIPLDCRLFYAKKGLGKIEIEGKIIEMPAGSLLYINSHVPYTILPSEVRYIAINFDFTSRYSHITSPLPPITDDKVEAYPNIEQIKFSNAPCFDKYLFCGSCASLCEIFEQAECEFTEKAPFYTLKNSNQISTVIIELFRKNEFGVTDNVKFDAKAIADYIESNLTQDLSNKKLAEIFHFHPNYMSSRFAQYYGKTLHSYILEMRIIKAIGYLEQGRGSIAEIAARVGFSDNNYFSRYFKKITGMSPKRYLQSVNNS